ncbi:hypothetical protein BOTNAR_0612g00060 [Botryotinia narcissicola]|uniref:Uncharacterized protein n=1 Tax=Botryotinia narcissicola TaxID=278944 RepID=A0A4Z1HAN4_9HELO|nr:hypothetical protein BOTNAR_0612g00060 [Botryotinia narcissicola]
MAEAIGIAAAIVQFVDIGLRTYLKLDQFCTDICDAPQIIQNLQVDLRQQLNIAENIHINHHATFQSVTAVDQIEILLLHYIDQIGNLEGLHNVLTNQKTDRSWRRGWKGIQMAKKKEEIMAVCGRLEQHKTSISMWLTETNLKLSAEIKSIVDQTYQGVQQTHSLVQKIGQDSSNSTACIQMMYPQMNRLYQKSTEVLENSKKIISNIDQTYRISGTGLVNTEEILLQSQKINLVANSTKVDTEYILPKVDEISANTQLLTQEVQNMNANWSRIHTFITSTPLPNSYENKDEKLDQQQIEVSQYLDAAWKPNTESPRQGSGARPKALAGIYTCRPRNQTSHWKLIKLIQLRQSFRIEHDSHCPRFLNSNQNYEFMIKNWNTNRALSIAPFIFNTRRIVDSKTSPAFQAVQDTIHKMKCNGFDQSSVFIPCLQEVLHNLYQNQKASPFDEDYNGNNLLHEILCVYKSHQTTVRLRSGCTPGDEYLSLIQFMMDSGVNSNVISSEYSDDSDKWDWWDKTRRRINGSALDIYVSFMLIPPIKLLSIAEEIRNQIMFDKLVSNGSEFTMPFNNIKGIHSYYYFNTFQDEMSELRRFPEQVERHGHEHLVSVILQRSERGLLRSIKDANINHASSLNGLTALHFAIEWPQALEKLLDNGVDVNVEDHYYRRPIYLAVALGFSKAVNILIQADCTLATANSPWGPSLLQASLMLCSSEFDTVVDSVFYLGIVQGTMVEEIVPEIKHAMLLHESQIPKALELDDISVYNTTDMHAAIRMTPRVAERLWQAGFVNIDDPDAHGLNPILQSWYAANFEMVSWFLQKGADDFSAHVAVAWHGLYFYAARVAYPGAYFSFTNEGVYSDTQHIARHLAIENLGHDDCDCLCSPRRCTPTSILMKVSQFYIRPILATESLYRSWVMKTKPTPMQLKQYSYDCIRMIIFESIGLTHSCCKHDQYCNPWRGKYHVPENYQYKKSILEEALNMFEECYQAYRGPMEMFPFRLYDFLYGHPSQGSQDNYGMVNWEQKDQPSGIEDAEELTEQEELAGEGGDVAEEAIDNEERMSAGE